MSKSGRNVPIDTSTSSLQSFGAPLLVAYLTFWPDSFNPAHELTYAHAEAKVKIEHSIFSSRFSARYRRSQFAIRASVFAVYLNSRRKCDPGWEFKANLPGSNEVVGRSGLEPETR
jgi:hypothetical protein